MVGCATGGRMNLYTAEAWYKKNGKLRIRYCNVLANNEDEVVEKVTKEMIRLYNCESVEVKNIVFIKNKVIK